jgi:cyclopropane-fatty-acyl-phospholipid synthase
MDKIHPSLTEIQEKDLSHNLHDPVLKDAIRILDIIFPQPRRFNIQLWNGLKLLGEPALTANTHFEMILNHPGAIKAMFSPPLELSLGEAYIFNDFDLEGDILEAMSLMGDIFANPPHLGEITTLLPVWQRLPLDHHSDQPHRGPAHLMGRKHSLDRDQTAVRYHYDVGNDFYAVWLGKRMQYSCAYFKSPSDDLDTAQENKLEHICRKIRLQPGDWLLDIGCGWGGLAVYAAEKYDANVIGITLSQEQYRLAKERISKAGLQEKIDIRLQDYRLLEDVLFDKIVSVGMVEHVGRNKLPEYFSQAYRLLKPGGLFLNHGISIRIPQYYQLKTHHNSATTFELHKNRPSLWQNLMKKRILGQEQFREKYFFPDGELEAISDLNLFAEKAGFEVRDVENLREHYALTLRRWVANMETNREEMIRQTNMATYRTWRLYMAASAYGFETDHSTINQTLLLKPDHGKSSLPLTRDWIYKG